MRRKLPVPEIVTCNTEYGAAYAWKCEGYGLIVYGNTKLDAQVDFQEVYEFEYGKAF